MKEELLNLKLQKQEVILELSRLVVADDYTKKFLFDGTREDVLNAVVDILKGYDKESLYQYGKD